MDFSTFPAQWEWVALILGGVALIMAVQPFLQMMLGRAKLRLIYQPEDREQECYYVCEIHNIPITNKFLRGIGIIRQLAQDVTCAFEIQDSGTGRIVCTLIPSLIKTSQGEGGFRVSVPASFFPAIAGILRVDKTGGKVETLSENPTRIKQGNYIAKVQVVAGDERIRSDCNFVVINKHPFVYWDVKDW